MTTVVVLVAVWAVVRFLGSTFAALRQVVPLSETVGAVFIVFVVPIGSAIFALAFRDFLKARVIANAPAECWPEAIHRISIASVDDLE